MSHHKNSIINLLIHLKFAIVSALIWPCLILLLIPVLSLRLFAIISGKCVPQLGRILSPVSGLFVVDQMYKDPSSTLAMTLTLEGEIDRKKLEDTFEKFTEENKYPELKQYLCRWMGFFFWRDDPTFELSRHLKYLEHSVNFEEMQVILKELVKRPYERNKPLWDILIISDYYPKNALPGVRYSAIAGRIHHSLADGFSLLNLFSNFSDTPKSMMQHLAKPHFLKRNFVQKIAFWLRLILIGPGEVLHILNQSVDKENGLKRTVNQLHGTFTSQRGAQISLEEVKNISKSLNVKTSALIFACITGAIRNMMIQMNKEIPNKMSIICPFPLPSHPDRLTNKMSVVPIPAPVAEPNPLERLRIIQSKFVELQRSTVPMAFAALISLNGMIVSLTSLRNRTEIGTAILSNFPGPNEMQSFLGLNILDFSVSTALQSRSYAAAFSSISYNGVLNLGLTTHSSMFPPEGKLAQQFLNLVFKELELFKDGFSDMDDNFV